MAAGRQYDASFVDSIEARKFFTEDGGFVLENRPIPDDDREYVLDSRIYEFTKARMAGEIPSAAADDFMMRRKTYSRPSVQIDDGQVEHKIEMADLGDRFIPVHIWTPAGHEEDSAVLVYLHGGFFVAGMVEQYQFALRHIAATSGAVVVYPEYRLAPETPFPGGMEDCVGVIEWVADNAELLEIDPERIAVAGDSAGGSLANAAVQTLARKGTIKLCVNIYPIVKSGPERTHGWSYRFYPITEGMQDEAKERVDRIKNSELESYYTLGDDEKLADSLISAVNCQNLDCFPRTIIVSSEYDFLRVQDEEFARLLSDAGVDVRAIRYLGCDHGFFEGTGILPQSEDLANIIAEELGRI